MTLEMPVWMEAASGDAQILYSARQIRTWIDATFATKGVVADNDLKVTQRAAGANMSVDIAAGLVVITGDAIANQGKYVARNTATYNVLVTSTPATGTRTDIIVAQLYDKQAAGGTVYGWDVVWLPGTTTVPGSAVLLAQLTVSAGAASITTSAIADKRALACTAGGPRPCAEASFAGSNPLTAGGFVGMSGWAAPSGFLPVGGMVINSATGIAVPRPGPYRLGGMAATDTAFSGGRRGVGYSVNGADVGSRGQVIIGDAGPGGTNVGARGILVNLARGDVVNLTVYQSAPGQLHVTTAGLSVEFAG